MVSASASIGRLFASSSARLLRAPAYPRPAGGASIGSRKEDGARLSVAPHWLSGGGGEREEQARIELAARGERHAVSRSSDEGAPRRKMSPHGRLVLRVDGKVGEGAKGVLVPVRREAQRRASSSAREQRYARSPVSPHCLVGLGDAEIAESAEGELSAGPAAGLVASAAERSTRVPSSVQSRGCAAAASAVTKRMAPIASSRRPRSTSIAAPARSVGRPRCPTTSVTRTRRRSQWRERAQRALACGGLVARGGLEEHREYAEVAAALAGCSRGSRGTRMRGERARVILLAIRRGCGEQGRERGAVGQTPPYFPTPLQGYIELQAHASASAATPLSMKRRAVWIALRAGAISTADLRQQATDVAWRAQAHEIPVERPQLRAMIASRVTDPATRAVYWLIYSRSGTNASRRRRWLLRSAVARHIPLGLIGIKKLVCEMIGSTERSLRANPTGGGGFIARSVGLALSFLCD